VTAGRWDSQSPASRLILSPGQLRVLLMREIQVQAAPATLDLLLKRLPGFECSKRSSPAGEFADPLRIGKIERARQWSS